MSLKIKTSLSQKLKLRLKHITGTKRLKVNIHLLKIEEIRIQIFVMHELKNGKIGRRHEEYWESERHIEDRELRYSKRRLKLYLRKNKEIVKTE